MCALIYQLRLWYFLQGRESVCVFPFVSVLSSSPELRGWSRYIVTVVFIRIFFLVFLLVCFFKWIQIWITSKPHYILEKKNNKTTQIQNGEIMKYLCFAARVRFIFNYTKSSFSVQVCRTKNQAWLLDPTVMSTYLNGDKEARPLAQKVFKFCAFGMLITECDLFELWAPWFLE